MTLAYDPYQRACPSRQFLKSLGDLWTVLILGALRDAGEPLRFKDIFQRVDGISTKMLTQTLRALERDGLVMRVQYAEVPPRVTYELSEVGRDLALALQQVEKWATSHMDEVLAARAAHEQG